MATTTAPAAASSSTPATAPSTLFRRKKEFFTIALADTVKVFNTFDGPRYAHTGDVIVMAADGTPVDVLPATVFAERYEPVHEGAVTLDPEHITRIAKVLRFGATKTADDLTKAVEQMATVRIGGIKIDFNPAQVEELKHRASKRGWTVEKYMEYLVGRFTQELWSL